MAFIIRRREALLGGTAAAALAFARSANGQGIPTAAADYLEYERFQMFDHLAPVIDSGKVKIFSVNSINTESWLNNEMEPAHKAIRHNDFP